MYENIVFIKDAILYDTTDRCSKQYRCANEMWLLSVFELTYRVITNICINYSGNGRIIIYGIDGPNNT